MYTAIAIVTFVTGIVGVCINTHVCVCVCVCVCVWLDIIAFDPCNVYLLLLCDFHKFLDEVILWQSLICMCTIMSIMVANE